MQSDIIIAGIGALIAVSMWALMDAFRRSVRSAPPPGAKGDPSAASRIYETAILKEIGDRIGYSLDIQQIVDIISGSLHQFIPFSAVSYLLIEPEDVLWKTYLEKPVNRRFIDDMRGRMLGALSVLSGRELAVNQVREVLTGAILTEDSSAPIGSFFNIPLVIGGKAVGVLTVADTKSGLYKEEEMTILYKIVAQASQAVTRLKDVVDTEEKKLASMVGSMTDGIIMMDSAYRVLVVNPAARGFLGLDGRTDITIFDLIQKFGDRFDVRRRIEEAVRDKKVVASDILFIDGKYLALFISPVRQVSRMGREEDLGSVITLHDATPEINLQRMRQEFTSVIVHDLRAPLSNINKLAELLSSDKNAMDKESFSEYLRMMSKDSSNMLDLVNDILDVAKYNAGKFQIEPTIQDIKELIKGRTEFYSISAKSLNVNLRSVFGATLPATQFDKKTIERVFNNFISNALKFTHAGGTITAFAVLHEKGKNVADELGALDMFPKLTIKEADYAKAGDALIFGVVDTGEGIPEEGLSRLFVKFEQLALPAANKKGGTGLGLAISKGIIEAHGGTIGASSHVGEGSMFYCILPLLGTAPGAARVSAAVPTTVPAPASAQ